MGTEIDKITVTFYGEDECKTANKFRKAVEASRYKSMNDALKGIIKEWTEKNGKDS